MCDEKKRKRKKFFESKPLRCLLSKKLVIKKFYKNLSYNFCRSRGRLLFKVVTLPCWWTTVATYHRQLHRALISTVVSREHTRSRISIILDIIKPCHYVIITSRFRISNKAFFIDIREKNTLFKRTKKGKTFFTRNSNII